MVFVNFVHISLSKYLIQKAVGYDLTMVDLGDLTINERILKH